MKIFKENYRSYSLVLITIVFILGGWGTCYAQSEKQYPQKIVLEMELEQVIKIKIPKVDELNRVKQVHPKKNGSVILKTTPKSDVVGKEGYYNENNK
jgi:hypothetical protein